MYLGTVFVGLHVLLFFFIYINQNIAVYKEKFLSYYLFYY